MQLELIVSALTDSHAAYSAKQHCGFGKKLPKFYNCMSSTPAILGSITFKGKFYLPRRERSEDTATDSINPLNRLFSGLCSTTLFFIQTKGRGCEF